MKTNIYCHRRLSHTRSAEGYSKKTFVTLAAIRDRIKPLHRSGELELIHRRLSRSTVPEPGSSPLTSQERCHGLPRPEARSANLGESRMTSNHDLEFLGSRRLLRSILITPNTPRRSRLAGCARVRRFGSMTARG